MFLEKKINQNFTNIVILCIIMTINTQLRLFNLPLGFGEIILLLLGFYVIYSQNSYEVIKEIFKNKILVLFWLLYLLILTLGSLYTVYVDIHLEPRMIVHDYLAYFFILMVIIILQLQNDYKENDYTMQKTIIFIVIFFSLVFIIPQSFFETFGLMKYYGGEGARFTALSKNPNQLSLLYSPILFLTIYYFKDKRRILFVLLILELVVITQIKGQALYLSIISGVISLFIYYLCIEIQKRRKLKFFLLFNFIIILCFLIIVALEYSFIYKIVFDIFVSIVDDSRTLALHRITLLINGFSNFMLSPIIGLGGGPHSYLEIVNHTSEAHNTLIDILTQTGIIGFFMYIILFYYIGKHLINQKKIFLFSALIALFVFSLFHFVLRQPIFWFYLFYLYNERKGLELVKKNY
ncbi:MAG: O-antigen ligase family protein [Arcobacteraceae bacterium]